MSLPRIENADVQNQRVFVRADFDLACDARGNISLPYALEKTADTIQGLLTRGASVVLGGHLGDPGNQRGENAGLEKVLDFLGKRLGVPLELVGKNEAFKSDKLKKAAPGEVFLLDNLLNFPGETKNSPDFATKLAEIADISVNDAFAASRYELASTLGIARFLPSFAGGNLYRDADAVQSLLSPDHKPLMLALGGVNLKGKTSLIKYLFQKQLHTLLIGGAIANTFLKSRAVPVGASAFEAEMQVDAFQIIEKAELSHVDLHLPLDYVVAERMEQNAKSKNAGKMDIPEQWQALDIGPKTLSLFEKSLKKAGSILWYGPLGAAEVPRFAKHSLGFARALAKSKARRVVLGQKTVRLLQEANMLDKVGHVCLSSESALKLLMNEPLPGLDALRKK